MSDVPTDDVEELEAFEIDDEEEELTLPDPPPAKSEGGARAQRRQARSTAPPPAPGGPGGNHPLEFLHNVEMNVTVELGRAKRTVRDLLEIQAGSVIELDRTAGSPVDVLVNGMFIARGEVVVVDDEFAVRITEIFDTTGQVNR